MSSCNIKLVKETSSNPSRKKNVSTEVCTTGRGAAQVVRLQVIGGKQSYGTLTVGGRGARGVCRHGSGVRARGVPRVFECTLCCL